MNKASDKNQSPVLGRAKTTIVLEAGDSCFGIVSEIVVRSSSNEGADRLVFRGLVKFKESTKRHLESVVLPAVDRITDNLSVSRKNYEISVKNIGATASAGIGIEISGFSADLPILLALLSASLQVGIRQDIVCTGHVATMEGDLAPVRGIPAKLDAALSIPDISAFVLPELEGDRSLQMLTPLEYQAAKESLLRHKGDIKIHRISGIHDAIRILMTDESIVRGSLKEGFFNAKPTVEDLDGPISMTVALLAAGNDKRFWDSIEHSFLNRKLEKAHLFLQTFANFHFRSACCPEKFGEQLLRLVISLPPSIRRLDNLFPLISMELFLNLSQHAKYRDYEDVRQLYKAIFNEGISNLSHPLKEIGAIQSFEDKMEKELFEWLLAEISEDSISEKVGQPLDEARASYAMVSVTVKDGFEFNEAITAFYTHMYRHTNSPEGHIKKAALSADAIDLVKNAFKSKGGYKAALSEGKHGTNGGMRLVFDTMTEYLKQIERGKYISMVFKEAIDSSDWDSKVRLTEVLKKLLEPHLPSELRELPAKQLTHHLEEIARCYVASMDKVSDLLKRL